jgi:hypothetical protein
VWYTLVCPDLDCVVAILRPSLYWGDVAYMYVIVCVCVCVCVCVFRIRIYVYYVYVFTHKLDAWYDVV